VISQRLLGNEEIILIFDTDCGVETFTDEEVKEQIYGDTALRLSRSLEAFEKAEDDVKQTARRIKASPFVPRKQVRGFVYEVKTGSLREVSLDRPVLRRVLASLATSGALSKTRRALRCPPSPSPSFTPPPGRQPVEPRWHCH
jgi:hypothetical protein